MVEGECHYLPSLMLNGIFHVEEFILIEERTDFHNDILVYMEG